MLGRNCDLTWKASAIAGVREKNATANGEVVDLSSDEDLGWRVLDAEPGQNEVSISVSGVTKSDDLKDDYFNQTRQGAMTLTYPNGGVLAGTFNLASYKEGLPYKDAVTFDAEFQSSGPVTYTPGS